MKAEWKTGRPPESGDYIVCYINSICKVQIKPMYYVAGLGWHLPQRKKYEEDEQSRVVAWDFFPELPEFASNNQVRELERIKAIERNLECLRRKYNETYKNGAKS